MPAWQEKKLGGDGPKVLWWASIILDFLLLCLAFSVFIDPLVGSRGSDIVILLDGSILW